MALGLTLNKLHRGDCLKLLEKVDEASVDLAFADPPFNIGYEYDVYKDKKSADEYLDWTRKWTAAVSRILKANGTFWIAIGDEFAAEIKMIVQRELGLICRSWVIWYYTFGVNCKKKFSRSHVHLFHFIKDPKKYTFNGMAIRVPSARQLVYGDTRADPDGRLPDDTWILRPHDVPDGFAPEGDTWFYPRVNGTFKERAGWHGCQMPEQVLGRIIKVSSNPGDVVLDPFAGSATTLAVAKKLERQWLGFELSEDYYKNGAKRLKSIHLGDRLEGPENPLYSVPNTANGRRLGEKKASAKRIKNSKKTNSRKPVPKIRPTRKRPANQRDLLIQAYHDSRDGYPSDWVLADPSLNEAFIERCQSLGVEGAPAQLNRQFLNLRKRGGFLKGPIRSNIPRITREKIDPYIFASEIAMGILSDQKNLALDSILCDPEIAKEFDETAGRLAPGWSPFEYRWAALWIRKREKTIAVDKVKDLPKRIKATKYPGDTYSLKKIRLSSMPEHHGIYILRNSVDIYLGHTFNLRQRLELHQQSAHCDLWGSKPEELAYLALSTNDQVHGTGLWCHWIQKLKPERNDPILKTREHPKRPSRSK